MRSRLSTLLRAGLLSLLCAPSGAALLPATGTFELHLGTLAQVVISGTGSASSMGGPGSLHTIPAGFFSVGTGIISVPIAPTIVASRLLIPAAQNVGGSFAPGGAMYLDAAGGFVGPSNFSIGLLPLIPVGGGVDTGPRLSFFAGEYLGATFQGAGAGAPITFMQSQSLPIWVPSPMSLTATAFDNRTSGGLGTVQLVAPATGRWGIFGPVVPIFGVVQIQYTPEPSTWILLGGGLVLLGVGRKKALRTKRD